MLTRTMNRSLRDRNLGPEAMYDYDLFAVVCHEGQIDNGHYTCFARSHDEVRPIPSPTPHLPFPVSFRVDCRVLTVLFPSLSFSHSHRAPRRRLHHDRISPGRLSPMHPARSGTDTMTTSACSPLFLPSSRARSLAHPAAASPFAQGDTLDARCLPRFAGVHVLLRQAASGL